MNVTTSPKKTQRPGRAGAFSVVIGMLAILGSLADGAHATSRPGEHGGKVSRAVSSPIQHVVIIYEENHSFDELLGQTCQTRTPACDGYVGPVRLADGRLARNITEPDIVPSVNHFGPAQQRGIANAWDRIPGCRPAPYRCVTHADPSTIPNITALAKTFVVSDRTFAEYPTSSFSAHVMIGAGTEDGFRSGYNPVRSKTGASPGPGWGCNSQKDIQWSVALTWVPSCIPSPDGSGPYRQSPVPYRASIMQRIESAGLTWHMYQGFSHSRPAVGNWSICTYFNWCLKNRFTEAYNSPTSDFISQAQTANPLPNVSFMLPMSVNSMHNQDSLSQGDDYIGRIVSAVENGPQWDSTAIFLTWDDCGCFYDHVKPPTGRSFRNPMIIISPWAKPDYTAHHVASQPYSMLAFIQRNFGLPHLSPSVDNAYGYPDVFNFTQHPRDGVAMTHTAIPHWEKVRIKQTAPLVRNDPT